MFGFENTDRLDVIQLYWQKYIDSNFNIQRKKVFRIRFRVSTKAAFLQTAFPINPKRQSYVVL